jgi:sugar lactone lactonase YvrE
VRLGEVNGAVLDRAGRLFVVDTTSRIFVLDAAGALVAVIPNDLPDVGRVELASLAIDDAGRLYIADIGAGMARRLIIAQVEAPLWPSE